MIPFRETIANTYSAVSLANPPGYISPWHWHDNYEIYFCETDGMRYLVGNTLYDIGKGDILVFNSFDVHQAIPPENIEYHRKMILFQPEFIQVWNIDSYDLLACFRFRQPDFVHYRHLPKPEQLKFFEFFEQCTEVATSSHKAIQVQQRLLLTKILIFLNDIFSVPVTLPPGSAESCLTQNILFYIEKHICNDINLLMLSRKFGLSVNTLNNFFKNETKMTLHQFIIQRRLQLARILLKDGKSVTETAYETGFGDLSHFIRTFKSKTGVTPGTYAANQVW